MTEGTVKPKCIFLSCTLRQNLEPTLQEAHELKNKHPDVEIGIGGPAMNGPIPERASRLQAAKLKYPVFFSTIEDGEKKNGSG